MIGDTGLVFLTRLAITIVSQVDYIVLGMLYTADVVGVYFFAFWYAAQGVRLVGSAIGSTLFSAFSKLRDEPSRQVDVALRAARTVALVCVPVSLLQALTARPVFHFLFDHRWDDAIPLVQLLSLGFASDAVTWAGGALLQAQRRLTLLVQMSLAFMVLFITIVTIGAVEGQALGVAIAVAGYYFFLAPIAFYVTVRPSGVTWWRSVSVYLRPWAMGAGAFAVAAAAGWGIAALPLFKNLENSRLLAAIEAAVIGVTGLGLYAALVRWSMPEELSLLWRKFKGRPG